MKSFMLLLAVTLILTVPAMAAPGSINYQGRLTNPSGQPIITPFDITFTFWNAETGGTQLGSGFNDTDTVTADANGIYTTLIGDDPGNPIPSSIFSGNSVWLNVRINGENLTPRKPVVSVGYAIHSKDADLATTANCALNAFQADNAGKLGGKPLSALATASHTHAAADIISGLISDALATDALTISSAGSVDGSAIKSGTVAAAQIDNAIARDSEILPAVLAGYGPGSTLDADTLDGLHASAFMSAASDNWVNTSGDTMTGALIVSGSASAPMLDVTNSNVSNTKAIQGTASGTGAVTNYGGYFTAAGNSGRGLFGQANGSSGIGILGSSSGSSGTGVYGYANLTGAVTNYGGYFQAKGNSGSAVYGSAEATGAATNYGGYFQAKGDSGRAVYGVAPATGAVINYGGYFRAAGGYGRGVQGYASTTGTLTNIGGYFQASGDSGRAVFGWADATGSASNYGGYFMALGNSGIGVHGAASATGAASNYGGYFEAAGNNATAIFGDATATGAVNNYGGRFRSQGDNGYGALGWATGSSGTGVIGTAFGNSGIGVKGYGYATGSVTNYGGWFEGWGNTGYGVRASGKGYDFYAAGTGTNYGPFTGAHEVQFVAGFPSSPKPGLIVVTAGPAKVRRDEAGQVSISSTLPTVRLADRPNDKAAFGVLVKELPLPEDHWYKPAAGERFGVVNALGEGRVWVCSAAGSIEMGDFITTSAIPGYGQKQSDDLQHTYTIGKVIESVDWDALTETIEHDGQVYKVYLIAVVYTCG